MSDEFLERLNVGDVNVADDVFRRFAARLVALARSQLEPRILQKVDPEDVVQSALNSFFTRHAQGQFQFADSEDLWSLLALMTVRKCCKQVDHFQADRRSIDREVRQTALDASGSLPRDVIGHDPTPSQAAILSETVETVMGQLEPRQRQILSLALQGLSHENIAGELNCSHRTVRRALDKTRHVLEELRLTA